MATDIVDLEEIVKDWALKMFDVTKTKEQGRIPKDNLEFTVNWKGVRSVHSEADFADAVHAPSPKAQVLFKTFFTNNTNMEQEYSFKTERTTRSTCDVAVEKGVTIGQEMSIKLMTPCEVFEANAGFKREVAVTKAEGESFEEELVWEVDSQIKVPSMHKTTAELVIKEEQFNSKFTVESKLWGKIHVCITDLRDNNSFVKSIEGNLADIVSNNGAKGVKVAHNCVCFKTKGNCSFRYAVEQHVQLDQEAL